MEVLTFQRGTCVLQETLLQGLETGLRTTIVLSVVRRQLRMG